MSDVLLTAPLRTPISDAVKQSITEAFRAVPAGKRGALLVIADVDDRGAVTARAMVAAKLGEHWKVAAGTAVEWDGPVTGTVAIQRVW